MDFARLAAAGYGPALLPIVPHDATVADYSWVPDRAEGERRRAQLLAQRGKTPGKCLRNGAWVGFQAFTKHVATPADHAQWARWPGAGAGLQAARFPALDIDVEDIAFVAEFIRRVQEITGFIYGRVGRAPRILLPFRAAQGVEFRKIRLDLPAYGEKNAIEFLATGQQYVIQGVHPKTGQPYSWGRRGFPEADRLPLLDADKVDRIFAAAAEMAGVNPLSVHATTGRSTEVQASVFAPNFLAVAEAIQAIPNDLVYDTWIRLGHAIKAVTDGAPEGLNLWAGWSSAHPETSIETCTYKWDSFHPPYHAGWDTIRAMVPAETVNLAAYDFTETKGPQTPLDGMLQRYVWVEKVKLAFDTHTNTLLDDLQFCVRNNHVATPRGAKMTPWTMWIADAVRLRRVHSVTYRPGCDAIVRERDGDCVNAWIAPTFTPTTIVEDAAAPWIEHMRYLVPDDAEREIFLDWLAHVVQRQSAKPNWQIVWGSRHHGVGKDIALEPVRRALGEHNVRNVHPEQLLSQRTDWYENARLIVVEEMKSYGKRELENKLRPFLAAPPHYVPISKVYLPTYEVPNIAALLFLTNEDNALPISKEDRRYFVLWAGDDLKPREQSYYSGIVDWYAKGGVDAAASWLMQRDISKFDVKGRAPMTAAKLAMIGATLSPLEAWLEDGIAAGDGAFRPDVVEVSDLMKKIPREFGWDGATRRRFTAHLIRAGGRLLGRNRLGKFLHTIESDRGTLFTLRRHEMYNGLDPARQAELFWKQREDAATEDLRGEFEDASSRGP